MRLFITLCFLLCIQTLSAQIIDTKVITANNGLISNNVHVSFVDAQGSLWLGSRAGLSMKNGTKFETVPQAIAHKFNNIYDILEDPQQGKWIASYGQGLLYFNETTTKLIDEKSGLIENKARSLFYHNQKVYVGTLNGVSIISIADFKIVNPKFTQNLNHFFSVTGFFNINNKVYATTINDGIYEVTPQQLIKVSDLKKTFASIVWNKHLYISTAENLKQLNPETFQIEKTFNVANVWEFLPHATDLFMVSSGLFDNNGGLFQIKDHQLIDKTQAFNIPFTDLRSIAFDATNQFLYLGSNTNGLVQINLNASVFHQKQFGAVHTLNVQDHKQFVFHEKGFTILKNNVIEKSLSMVDFKRFQEKDPFYLKNYGVKNHFYEIDHHTSPDKILFYSSKIHKNHLWVASNIGIFQLDVSGRIVSYHPIHIFYFTFFNNDLIAAVPYAGVRIFHNIHTMDYSYAHDWNNPEIPAEIVSMTQTDDAVYFASALSGLYQYKNGSYRSFLQDESFTEAKLKQICTTKEGHLLVVTDFNEVYLLDVSQPKPKILKHIPHHKIKGNTTTFVNNINDILYIGTNQGINVFKGDRYFFIDRAQGFTNYNSTMATAHENNLYIATAQGYFVLNTDVFNQPQKTFDRVVISNVYINNQLVPKTDFNLQQPEIQLAYNENNVRLLFSVPNAKYPDKLTFKFRLKNTEPWQDLTDDNLLILNYLNNGIYDVQLQITNENTGNVSIQNLIKLTIKPPFYYTWTFILGCILILFVGIWMIYKMRIRYLDRNQERERALTALQNQQEKKALLFDKQLADVKLQALKSQMNSHFLFNVLGSIQYFIISKEVDSALYYLERFSQLIRTTLDYSDKKSISLYHEIAYLKQYIEIENLRAEHPIVFTEHFAQEVDVTQITIVPLLLQPFIENAIVHAFPPSVSHPEITLKVEKKTTGIQITLTDNGIGYQQKKDTLHNSKGIAIAQNRLELTQKNLSTPIQITSSSKGTQVIIFID